MSSRTVVTDEDVLGGEPRLEGTRIRVSDVAVKYDELRYSVDEILEAYPRLTKGDVHEALAYYYRNRKEVLRPDVSSTGAEPA